MKLDIALPFYGDVAFLKETVASVLAQTDPNWRLQVVDDGYPDDSLPEWFSELNDSRISYLRNPQNLGANGNFQKCLSLLSSEYCLVMGADDILDPDFISEIKSKSTIKQMLILYLTILLFIQFAIKLFYIKTFKPK